MSSGSTNVAVLGAWELRPASFRSTYEREVAARLKQHQVGRGAKYTRGRGPLELAYQEACGSKAEALRRERALKRMRRSGKEALIAATGRP